MTTDDTAPEPGPTTGRVIDLSVTVPGTPEQVWEAVASGPGISAWFVPTRVEPEVGGSVLQDFGTGMEVEGRVTRWEPPRAFAFGAESEEGTMGAMAFEFLVEARDGGSCVVRLVNSGFGEGDEWDGQYDGMTEGWKLFLHNLVLHLTHFPGRPCRSVIVNGMAAGPREAAWKAYAGGLGVPTAPAVGDQVVTGGGSPAVTGTVERAGGVGITLLTTAPAPGVAFLAAEGQGDQIFLSFYGYFYDDDADVAAVRESWQAWMSERFPMPSA